MNMINLRTKLANFIRPKKVYKHKLGKLGIASIVEGSGKVNFSFLNGTIKVSADLETLVKNAG